MIVVGGSYSGSIATWLRQLYPEKITGAWASSAPLLAQLDFPEYMKVVTSVLKREPECQELIKEAFSSLDSLILMKDEFTLNNTFNLCNDLNFTNTLDILTLKKAIRSPIAKAVETGRVKQMCSFLTKSSHENALQALGNWVRTKNEDDCTLDSFESLVEEFEELPWMYQTCNEFGWYQTISNASNVSTVECESPLSYDLELCQRLFG